MSLIDDFVPDYQFSERHARRIAADPVRIIDAVATYQPEVDPFFKAMIGLREMPTRALRRVTRKGGDLPAPFGLHNFTLLSRRDDQLIYGLIGQFWKADYGLRAVANGESFAAFDEEDTAKLVLGFSALREEDGTTRLCTETRVFCPDRATRLKFTPYWFLVRPVSGLIRRRILSSIKKRSEKDGLVFHA